jgi:hypothetical protein
MFISKQEKISIWMRLVALEEKIVNLTEKVKTLESIDKAKIKEKIERQKERQREYNRRYKTKKKLEKQNGNSVSTTGE